MRVKTTPQRVKKSATSLSKGTLQSMLDRTYQKENLPVENYVADATLSDNRVKVFHDPTTNHTVVAHRGSSGVRDWLIENPLYLFNVEAGYGWNNSKRRQKAAEKKYGTENLTTIGHSKGALHA